MFFFIIIKVFLNADAEYFNFIYGKPEDTANCLWKI